jgi:tetratricopeptide (TPR) repeat protein
MWGKLSMYFLVRRNAMTDASHRRRHFFASVSQKNKEQWLAEGSAFVEAERGEEALAAYEHVLLLDPTEKRGYCGKGAALSLLQRYDEALAAYDEALLLDHNYLSALVNQGDTLANLKRYDEALASYEKALQLPRSLDSASYAPLLLGITKALSLEN